MVVVNLNFDENEEAIKAKGKMVAITTLSVIGVIIVFIILGIFIIKSFFSELSKKYYYTLEINDNNRNQIIRLFEEENVYDPHYCSSMYKIEYAKSFPDGTSYTIYCKDEDNIHFGIDKVEEDKLQSYIYENGTVESR